MTPYPARVDRDTIIQTAREIIEADGLSGISLNRLARSLGIKTPSLYHHVKNKTDLLQAINTLTREALLDAVSVAAAAGGDNQARIQNVAAAYRAYALAHPVTYRLLYDSQPPCTPGFVADSTLVTGLISGFAGPDQTLHALRGFWALLHGFVMLELAGCFLPGNEVSHTWHAVLAAYLTGWPDSGR